MKDIYYNIKEKCKLPVARLSYTYRDFEGVIQSGNSVNVNLSEDEANIKLMEGIKEKYAQFFMFFNNSPEGIDFWRKNTVKLNIQEGDDEDED